jgi:NAD(P)-dependent dehydrogenase (short-subunit alcohol dehydrogenase family)
MSTSDSSRTLAGAVAIVTGSTRGVGEAIAREFAARGAAGLVLTGRNAARGEAVARSIADAATQSSQTVRR